MNSFWTNVFSHWKSTASNLLTLIVLTGGYLTAIPVTTLQQNGITQKEMFWGMTSPKAK